MRVLIACEYSGIVRRAFRARGHSAYSCDFLEAEDSQEFHYRGDVLMYLNWDWDLLIAHPPCTRLTIAGAGSFNRPGIAQERDEAMRFFLSLLSAPVPRIALENPIPFNVVTDRVGKYDQIVNPFEFGEPIRKKICLWLRNLPKLVPTNIVEAPAMGYCIRKTGARAGRRYNYYHHQGKNGHNRSRFFPGIADAMADQWGTL